jgi:hypothetical protein
MKAVAIVVAVTAVALILLPCPADAFCVFNDGSQYVTRFLITVHATLHLAFSHLLRMCIRVIAGGTLGRTCTCRDTSRCIGTLTRLGSTTIDVLQIPSKLPATQRLKEPYIKFVTWKSAIEVISMMYDMWASMNIKAFGAIVVCRFPETLLHPHSKQCGKPMGKALVEQGPVILKPGL